MEELILIKPDLTFEDEIQTFRLDMLIEGSSMDGTGQLKHMRRVPEWLAFNARFENKTTVPEKFVPAEQFIFVRKQDRKIVGMLQFRHELNDLLENFGGHIGYSIRPDERRKGYAKKMLAAALEKCVEQGLDQVLITCKTENEASRRTILANGGVYQNTVYHRGEDIKIERYLIPLSK